MKKQLMFGLIFLTVVAMLVAGCQTQTGGAFRTKSVGGAEQDQILIKFYSDWNTDTGTGTLASQQYGTTTTLFQLEQTKQKIYEKWEGNSIIEAGFTVDDIEPGEDLCPNTRGCLICLDSYGYSIYYCVTKGYYPAGCECFLDPSSCKGSWISTACGSSRRPA